MQKPIVRISIPELGGTLVDVGSGGEAVIARACGPGITCLDVCKEEIQEAKRTGVTPELVLCDACNMPFGRKTFDAATLFFSLMYIKTKRRKRALLREIKRVLKPGGKLHLWGTVVEEKPDPYVVEVKAVLPDGKAISAGYGVGGKWKKQNAWLVRKLAEEMGLEVAVDKSHDDLLEFILKAL